MLDELCQLEVCGRCCCTCRWRLRALDQESFPRVGVVGKGWACVGWAFVEAEPVAYIGDFEHGLCELYQRRGELDE